LGILIEVLHPRWRLLADPVKAEEKPK